MNTLMQDVRYALRSLLRTPGFTVVAVLTLALGIGANTTLFSVLYAALLRPLPYLEPDRIVSIGTSQEGRPDNGTASHLLYQEWRAEGRALTELGAYNGRAAIIGGDGMPERVTGAYATSSLFSIAGSRPLLGRFLREDDERPGTPETVVLSHALWKRRFGGDSAIIGRAISMNAAPVTVVGIAPASFDLPRNVQFWRPLQLPAAGSGISLFISVVGRLAPGATLDGARAQLAAIALRGDAARPEWQRGAEARVVTLHERRYGSTRPLLLILLGTVALVLLIACANVASLLLARATAREREFALRTALGASRGRLVRLLLVESTVLAAIGGAVALLVPAWGIPLLVRVGSLATLRTLDIGVDGVVVAATAAIALVTGLGFGLVPAFGATRLRLRDSLAGGGAGAQPKHARLRRTLVAGQLATALVLLVGAMLLTRSLVRITSVDPGFQPDHVLGATIDLPRATYPDDAATNAFYGRLLDRVEALPGVQSAALADMLPLQGFRYSRAVNVDGAPVPTDGSDQANFNSVTDGYFATVGMTVEKGRPFASSDVLNGAPVAIVNAAFARRFFPDGDAVGHTINMNGEMPVNPTIVGVVRDVRQIGLDVAAAPEVFRPASQSSELPQSVVLRTVGDPALLGEALRRAVLEIDPAQPVSRVFTLEDDLALTTAPRRANAALVGSFAILALLLSALGLYGVMAYTVTQRTREIGVRIALGARPGAVARLVVGEGARVALIGGVIGIILARAFSRVLADFLFEVHTTDVATFIVAPVLLVGVALLASWLPARRAARTDPMVALRSE